jgi:hypothetical protein
MPDPLCNATTVIYNGLTIRNVLTDQISSETIYDRTGVDPIGVRTRMSFVAELYGTEDAPAHHGHTWAAPGTQLADGVKNVIQKFLLPRQELIIMFGADVLFHVLPGGAAKCAEPQPSTGQSYISIQDISNGPRTTCQVIAVRGAKAAKCRFTVEFMLPSSCGPDVRHDILNIRWRVADDIECQSWLTRRVYEGAIRFRTRVTDAYLNPHMLARTYAFPPLLRGFRRESIAYHEDSNALEISFVIVDQELFAAAPSPATFWDGTYTLTLSKGAASATQDLSFVLKGDKTLPKGYLGVLAMYIIDAKMSFRINRGPTDPAPNMMLMSAVFQERLSDNEIRVSVQTFSSGDEALQVGISQGKKPGIDPMTGLPFQNTWTHPLPPEVSEWDTGTPNPRHKKYDPEVTTIPDEFSAGVSTLLCALQNPCCIQDLRNPGLGVTPAIHADTYGSPKVQRPYIFKRDKQLYDEKQNKASYAYYRMSSELITDTGWRAFPLGKQCVTGSDSSQATVAFSHLHCPVQIRKVTINAMRINAWPELPKPVHWIDDTGPRPGIKHILKTYTIEPMPVQLSADGCDSLHEVIATYYYYLDRPYKVGSQYKMPVGRIPFVSKAQLASHVTHEDSATDGDKRAISQMFFLDPKELLESFP